MKFDFGTATLDSKYAIRFHVITTYLLIPSEIPCSDAIAVFKDPVAKNVELRLVMLIVKLSGSKLSIHDYFQIFLQDFYEHKHFYFMFTYIILNASFSYLVFDVDSSNTTDSISQFV